ncbi:MAG TPA: DUF2252 family protein [Kofleriaceae bacterium]|jgi:uncharacterized protein (DUF2252 family)
MRSSALAAALALAACASPARDARDAYVIDTLAEDNYMWALRDPSTVAMKLTLMQESPFLWLRGTAPVFWRDLTTPGVDRPATRFGDPASSRVLLVADPHPENLGSFRAPDGTMLIDFDDFDGAGYGPFEGDVRRLAAGMIIAANGAGPTPEDLASAVATAYAAQIADLANGVAPAAGTAPYLDKLIAKAQANGDAHKELADDVASPGVLETGDLDPIDSFGVIQNRVEPIATTEHDEVTAALAPLLAAHPELGAIEDIGRRYGHGVSSYPAWRYLVLLAGETSSPGDDRVLEIKEERDGLDVENVPQLDAAEWSTPAARAVNTAHRLWLRPDEDPLWGAANLAPLSLVTHDDSAYQRGVDSGDLGDLASSDPDQLLAVAGVFGRLLARAHGLALTEDGVLGWTAIAPVLGDGFPDEVASFASADAAQIIADYQSFAGRDLPSLVLPAVHQ